MVSTINTVMEQIEKMQGPHMAALLAGLNEKFSPSAQSKTDVGPSWMKDTKIAAAATADKRTGYAADTAIVTNPAALSNPVVAPAALEIDKYDAMAMKLVELKASGADLTTFRAVMNDRVFSNFLAKLDKDGANKETIEKGLADFLKQSDRTMGQAEKAVKNFELSGDARTASRVVKMVDNGKEVKLAEKTADERQKDTDALLRGGAKPAGHFNRSELEKTANTKKPTGVSVKEIAALNSGHASKQAPTKPIVIETDALANAMKATIPVNPIAQTPSM